MRIHAAVSHQGSSGWRSRCVRRCSGAGSGSAVSTDASIQPNADRVSGTNTKKRKVQWADEPQHEPVHQHHPPTEQRVDQYGMIVHEIAEADAASPAGRSDDKAAKEDPGKISF